jgi:hypothetical protein
VTTLKYLFQLQNPFIVSNATKEMMAGMFIKAGLTRAHFNLWLKQEEANRAKFEWPADLPRQYYSSDTITNTDEESAFDKRLNKIFPFKPEDKTIVEEKLRVDVAELMVFKPLSIESVDCYLRYKKGFGIHIPSTLFDRVPRVDSIVPRVNSIVPRVDSIAPRVDSIVPRVNSIVPRVNRVPTPEPIIPPQPTKTLEKEVNIFVDYSNLHCGLTKSRLYTPEENRSMRFNIRELVNLLCTDPDKPGRRVVTGSNIPENIEFAWIKYGFEVKSMTLPPGIKEKFVDEALHSCIAQVLLSPKYIDNPQTLVLGTGDGNDNEGTNSFPNLADAAARHGWTVIIWSWSFSLSQKFKDLQTKYPNLVHINTLDEFRDKIVTMTTAGKKYMQPVPRAPTKKY